MLPPLQYPSLQATFGLPWAPNRGIGRGGGGVHRGDAPNKVWSQQKKLTEILDLKQRPAGSLTAEQVKKVRPGVLNIELSPPTVEG